MDVTKTKVINAESAKRLLEVLLPAPQTHNPSERADNTSKMADLAAMTRFICETAGVY